MSIHSATLARIALTLRVRPEDVQVLAEACDSGQRRRVLIASEHLHPETILTLAAGCSSTDRMRVALVMTCDPADRLVFARRSDDITEEQRAMIRGTP